MLVEQLKKYRLSKHEYELICDLLKKPMEGLEWSVFSALWSEHCSYKSSKVHLKKFYNKNKIVIGDSDENAGVIDLGMGEKVAFKMESHNHPSFISPHQGAATGVGGILRDIFTMGARPIALANYLCFGSSEDPKMPWLVDGVVRGIADYGNCVGVPMLTGRTHFHKEYNNNILVNAFALGYFGPEQKIVSSKIPSDDLLVVYAGAKTGRDGIHGASMASESFSDKDSESKKPTIQIGDPFFEKLLIEACLEVIDKDLVVSMQDMGAAGLTSSSFEMSVGGGFGIKMDLNKVPLRDSSLTAEDILLSESQERMLLVCKESCQKEIEEVFSKWGLEAVVIGITTKNPEIELLWGDESLLKIDPKLVVDHAPRHNRPYTDLSENWDQPKTQNQLSTPAVTSKQWVYSQYDQRVGARTAKDCSHDVGVIKLPNSDRFLGIAMGCEPELMRENPWLGSRDAVIRPCLKLALQGMKSLALTDCLNFGNPEKPELMSEFVASVEGINDICIKLDVPVISGNVSFYNETHGQNIISTPATVVVGIGENPPKFSNRFTQEDLNVFVVSINAHKFYKNINSHIDLIRQWVNQSQISSLAMVSLKGLKYTLEKMCLDSVGVSLQKLTEQNELYQFVVSTPNAKEMFQPLVESGFASVHLLGKTQKDSVEIEEVKTTSSDLNLNNSKVWEAFLGRFA